MSTATDPRLVATATSCATDQLGTLTKSTSVTLPPAVWTRAVTRPDGTSIRTWVVPGPPRNPPEHARGPTGLRTGNRAQGVGGGAGGGAHTPLPHRPPADVNR